MSESHLSFALQIDLPFCSTLLYALLLAGRDCIKRLPSLLCSVRFGHWGPKAKDEQKGGERVWGTSSL